MALAPGTKLGRCEIRSKIGEGGMGEVYCARGEQLNREVARSTFFRQHGS